MKKKTLRYLAYSGLFIVVLSFSYYGSYLMSLNRFKEQDAKENLAEENLQEDEFLSELAETDTTKIDRISENTQCILEVYDLQEQLTEVKAADIKSNFYGFTREEVMMYLEAFTEEMPEAERAKGLVSYELVSFGADEVVLRKSYDSNRMEYEFFMKAENDEVIVYFSDRTRIFEYTGIVTTHLSEEEKQKLEDGFYVKNREELYGILENYSS